MAKANNNYDYMAKWDKENMKTINTRYKADFVNEFKQACKDLGILQSDAFREAMQKAIKKAQK